MRQALLLAGMTLAGCAAAGAARPPAAGDPLADPALVAALRAESEDSTTRFAVARANLHGGAPDEIVAYLHGPRVCGSGGCNLLILERRGSGYRVVARASVTRAPIRMLSTRSTGWRDLSVAVSGGGMAPRQVRLRHGANGYPANPTILPEAERVAADAGTVLIADPPSGVALPSG